MTDNVEEVGVRLVVDGHDVFATKIRKSKEEIKALADEVRNASAKFKLGSKEISSSSDPILKFSKDIRGAFRDIDQSFHSFGSGIGTVTSGVGKLATLQFMNYNAWGVLTAGISGAAGAATYFGLKTYSGLEQANIAFTQFLGSADKSTAFMNQLKDFAATTPFDFTTLVPTAQRLLNTGDDPAKALQDLKAIGDAASGADPLEGQAGVDRIALALGQIKMAPKLGGQELMQLRNANIDPYKYLAEAKGVSKGQIMADQQKGLIPGAQAAEVILAGMEKQYGGLMAKQSKTLSGQIPNLRDKVSFGLADATKPLAELLERNMPMITEGLTTLVTMYGRALKVVLKDGQLIWAAWQLDGMNGAMGMLGKLTGTGDTFQTIWTHIKTDSHEMADIWQNSLYPAIQDVNDILGPLAFGSLGAVEEILKWMADHPDAAKVMFEGMVMVLSTYKVVGLLYGVVGGIKAIQASFVAAGAAAEAFGNIAAISAAKAASAAGVGDASGMLAAAGSGAGGKAAKSAWGKLGSGLSKVGKTVGITGLAYGAYEGGLALNDWMNNFSSEDAADLAFIQRIRSGAATDAERQKYEKDKANWDRLYPVNMDLSKVPQHGEGALAAGGGFAITGDKGRELRYTPPGTVDIPLDQAFGGSNKPFGGVTVVFQKGAIEAADYLQGEALANTVVEHIRDKIAKELMVATVTLSPVSYPGADITAMLNADVPTPSEGGARWNKLERPRRRTALEFAGEELLTLTFGIMLDAFPDGEVEGLCRRIYGWWSKNEKEQPTILHITGPVPYSDLDYVINKIDSSGIVERRSDGMRSRQELKFELYEYIAPDLITSTTTSTPAATVAQAITTGGLAVQVATGGGGTYVVRKGDTLSGIAAAKLGFAKRWQEIATLNSVRDPRRLQIGQTLRLP